MNVKRVILFFCCLLSFSLSSTTVFGQEKTPMTESQVQIIVGNLSEESEHEPGMSTVYFGDRWILVLTDEALNRLRVMTPIKERKNIGAAEMEKMLLANFSTALDAKYSFYDQYVVSSYSHPLDILKEEQLIDALEQVVMLARTFGTTYSSAMIFDAEASLHDR